MNANKSSSVVAATGAVAALVLIGGTVAAVLSQQPPAGDSQRVATTGSPAASADTIGGDTSRIEFDALRQQVADLRRGSGNANAAPGPDEAAGQRMDKLESLLLEVANEQRALAHSLASLSENQSIEAQPAEPVTLEQRQETEAAEVQAQVSYIDEAVLSEAVDPEWAPAAQARVHEAFAAEAMVGFSVASADCRSSLCRVELDIDPDLAGPDVYRALQRNAPWNGAGVVEVTNDPPGVVLYLAREGASMPSTEEDLED